ncbi:DNA-dependent RNA polymerase [Besnoitia besnoiti]|uniref:DNA-directed RNA polymerase n=1 Tax=Besnoitia besnoiti TaxID=94643 RepID=A0A2A9MQ77_BESBE|nr:DNA-dependent RNA polymerase [Besnoitia besnoiti]PFH38327.1 DNA-dependent RNA polymerase [Besnoitia besnoiti]
MRHPLQPSSPRFAAPAWGASSSCSLRNFSSLPASLARARTRPSGLAGSRSRLTMLFSSSTFAQPTTIPSSSFSPVSSPTSCAASPSLSQDLSERPHAPSPSFPEQSSSPFSSPLAAASDVPLSSAVPSSSAHPSCPVASSLTPRESSVSASEGASSRGHFAAAWPFRDALDALEAQGVHTLDEQARTLGFASGPHLGLETLRRLSPEQEKLVFHWLLTGDLGPAPAADATSSSQPPQSTPSQDSPLSPPSASSPARASSPPSLPACVLSCLHILEEELLLKGLVISDLPRDVFFSHLRDAALPQEIAAEQAEKKQRREAEKARGKKLNGVDWSRPQTPGALSAPSRTRPTEKTGVHTPQRGFDGEAREGERDQSSESRQELLNSAWVMARKKEIYGDNPYPFPLRWTLDASSSVPPSSAAPQLSASAAPQLSTSAAPVSQSLLPFVLQEQPSSSSAEEPSCILEKRQIIVERCVWQRMLEEVDQQKSFLSSAACSVSGSSSAASASASEAAALSGGGGGASEPVPADRGISKRVWCFWVNEMRTRIAAMQAEQKKQLDRYARKLSSEEEEDAASPAVRAGAPAAEEAEAEWGGRRRRQGGDCEANGLQKDIESDKTLLPLDLDPTVLALITARTAVQLIVVPTASSAVVPGKKGRADEVKPAHAEEEPLFEESDAQAVAEDDARDAESAAKAESRIRVVHQPPRRASGDGTEAAATTKSDRPTSSEGAEEGGEEDEEADETVVAATAAALIQNRSQRQVPVTQMALAIGTAVNLEVNALRSDQFFRGADAGGGASSPFAGSSSSSRLILPQPRLFREHELLQKRAQGKTLDPRERRELQRLLSSPSGHHELWDIKKKLQVGGLLLGVLLRHAFVEADYAAAKRELAEELHQKEREKECMRRAKEKKREAERALRKAAGENMPRAESEAAEADAALAQTAHDEPAKKERRGRPKPLFGTAFDSEDFAHLTVYRSRRSFSKVEVPAFCHRLIYNAKTQRFLGVIQMRRVCYSQLVSGEKYTSFFGPGKNRPPPPSRPVSAAGAAASPLSAGGAPAGGAQPPSNFRTLPSAGGGPSPSFWLFLKYLPMIIPPLPWEGYSQGAYLMLRNSFVRAVSYGEVKSTSKPSSRQKDEEESDLEDEEKAEEDMSESAASGAEVAAYGDQGVRSKKPKRGKAGKASSSSSTKTEKITFLGGAGRAKMARDFHAYDTTLPRAVVSALGSQPWRINKDVLSVMEAAWERGLELGRLPSRDSSALEEEILRLKQLDSEPRRAGLSAADASAASIRLRHLLQQAAKLQSERPSFLLKLQVARCFQNVQALYFPHNIDFRGRCYPLPPHLNHMGDDVCRSLLVFAQPKPLGPTGLGWLKVHVANLFGVNKLSFADRQAWVDSRLDDFIQVANDPLHPRSLQILGQEADDPWQALGAILELKKVVDHGVADSAQFLSSLPIHQDGSCNGLQHYAALGRDRRGGEAVNLVGGAKPQDVYTFVLEVVKMRVFADAAAQSVSPDGRQPLEKTLAALLIQHNLLQRKVVKQTVMTICYGVTAVGARDQVTRQLEDLIGETVDAATLKSLGVYLARVVLSSIGEVFESAMRLKKWLDEVSKMLNRLGLPVSWFLPLIHFGAEQPYRSGKALEVKTVFQTHIVRVAGEDTPTSASKQRLGFPPNFIHSLDATHMMLTARRCLMPNPPPLVPPYFADLPALPALAEIDAASREQTWAPMAFAAVHDSYWTLAGDVDRMRRILRQEFVRLYSQPILEEFYEGLRARLGRVAEDLPPPPTKGSLDITEVLNSDYFFH